MRCAGTPGPPSHLADVDRVHRVRPGRRQAAAKAGKFGLARRGRGGRRCGPTVNALRTDGQLRRSARRIISLPCLVSRSLTGPRSSGVLPASEKSDTGRLRDVGR
jgi:hypothetical protein